MEKVENFYDYAEHKSKYKVEHLRFHKGEKYGSTALNNYSHHKRIVFENFERNLKQQKSVIERSINIVMDRALVMILNKDKTTRF